MAVIWRQRYLEAKDYGVSFVMTWLRFGKSLMTFAGNSFLVNLLSDYWVFLFGLYCHFCMGFSLYCLLHACITLVTDFLVIGQHAQSDLVKTCNLISKQGWNLRP